MIQDWFNGLATREKALVGLAAALSLLALVVVSIIRPLAAGRGTAIGAIADKRAILADIDRVAARFGPNAGSAAATPPSGESLVVLIDRTTRSSGLGAHLKRNEPDGNSSIRLRFEEAPFDDLMAWLAALQAAQGISVTTATVDPGRDLGRVNANLQLSRSSARRR